MKNSLAVPCKLIHHSVSLWFSTGLVLNETVPNVLIEAVPTKLKFAFVNNPVLISGAEVLHVPTHLPTPTDDRQLQPQPECICTKKCVKAKLNSTEKSNFAIFFHPR